jgi:hypothetical protein
MHLTLILLKLIRQEVSQALQLKLKKLSIRNITKRYIKKMARKIYTMLVEGTWFLKEGNHHKEKDLLAKIGCQIR